MGGGHSSVVSSASTILRPRVGIPSTPSRYAFLICIIEIVMRKGQNKQIEAGIGPFKTTYLSNKCAYPYLILFIIQKTLFRTKLCDLFLIIEKHKKDKKVARNLLKIFSGFHPKWLKQQTIKLDSRKSFKRRLSSCHNQCDQIGRFLKVLGDKLTWKSCQIVWWLFGRDWKT